MRGSEGHTLNRKWSGRRITIYFAPPLIEGLSERDVGIGVVILSFLQFGGPLFCYMFICFGRYTAFFSFYFFTDILLRREGWWESMKKSFAGYVSYAPFGYGREFYAGPLCVFWSAEQ